MLRATQGVRPVTTAFREFVRDYWLRSYSAEANSRISLYTPTNLRQQLTDAIKTGDRLSFGKILKNFNGSWKSQYCYPTCAIELKSVSRQNHRNLNKHIASEWCLFIDSNKASLKGVSLHNGNEFSSIPVAYASHLKECYEVIKMLVLKINYHSQCWSICSDFKVIAILLGMQTGYTKYCCFLYYWDCCNRDKHYTVKIWSECDRLNQDKETLLKTLW